ncbi:tRNA(m5U54)methyltransferase [Tulasnella sp. 418]|nr:tRNA(m5U54)methyltransferase [Tulasnella sp. 418]
MEKQRSRSVTPDDHTNKRPRLEDSTAVLLPKEESIAAETSSTLAVASSEVAVSPSKKDAKKKRRQRKQPPPESGSSEDILLRDVKALLGEEAVQESISLGTEFESPLSKGQELEVIVSELSSNGEGICLVPSDVSSKPWTVIVPFVLPQERVKCRVYAHSRLHSLADLIEVIEPNPELRDMSRVKCKYFGVCSGCQYQMLSYDTQLDLKRKVVDKAYVNFSGLPEHLFPEALPTIASPKTYGYRTKITPHFDLPPELQSKKRGNKSKSSTNGKDDSMDINMIDASTIPIGFGEKGRRRVIDIEECVIASPVLNKALGPARDNVRQ